MSNQLQKKIRNGVFTFVLLISSATPFFAEAKGFPAPGPCDSTTLNISLTQNNDSASLCLGSAYANVTGGQLPYYYYWSNGDSTANVNSLCTGSYTVVVTDAMGCSVNGVAVIVNDSFPPDPCSGFYAYTTHTNDSAGLCIGTASANVSGGQMPYTFFWSTTDTTPQVNNLCVGSYTLTVTDYLGCNSYSSVNIGTYNYCDSFNVYINTTNDSAGFCVGSATANVASNYPPYTYSWSNGGTVQQVNGLCTGTVSVTVTDNMGCSASVNANVGTYHPCNTTSLNVYITFTNDSAQLCVGTASANVTGGYPPYAFNWSTGDTVQNLTNICDGSISVTVTDTMGCVRNANAFVPSDSSSTTPCDSSSLNLSLSKTDVTGFCNGSVTANVSGGQSPYVYSWSTGHTTSSKINLCAGLYVITVTDANGCTRQQGITVNNDTSSVTPCDSSNLNLVLNQINANGSCNGTATANVTGGSSPYIYNWSHGGTTAHVNNLCVGSYSLLVTDASGCTRSGSLFIINDSTVSPCLTTTISITLNVFNANGGCNGSLTSSVGGGLPPYVYSWSNGATTAQLNNLCAAGYTLLVTDANGCTNSKSATVIDDPCLSSTLSVTVGHVNANGGCNGSVSSNVSGGQMPYTYSWNNGTSVAQMSNVCAGGYTLVVTDAMGCTRSAWAAVGNDSVIVNPCDSSNLNLGMSHVNASSGCNGSASSNVTGGTPPYSYSWSNGSTAVQLSGQCSGTYSLTVTDANGCYLSSSVFIMNDTSSATSCDSTTLSIVLNKINANSGCNGSVSVNASGGQTPYAYNWSPSGAVSPQVSNLCPGTYSVLVTDASGCTKNGSIAVANDSIADPCQSTSLSVSASSGNATNPAACNGTITGTATGGTTPYNFNWSNGAFTAHVTNRCVGSYTVTVMDADGCSRSAVTTVMPSDTSASAPDPCLGFGVNVGGSTTVSTCVGTATANVSAGNAPFSYSWSNYYNTPSVSDLCPGVYNVVVTDSMGCSATAGITIYGDAAAQAIPLSLFVTAADASAASNCDGTVSVAVSGGKPPYSYLYSNGATTASVNSLCPGFYSVHVTDDNGVIDTVGFVIASPAAVFNDTTNSTFSDSVIVATILAPSMETCAIDLANVDSVNLDSYYLMSEDTLSVTWAVFSNASTTPDLVVNKYGVGSDGVYTLILQLFCDGGSIKTMTSMTGGVGFLKAVVQVYVTQPDPLTLAIASQTQVTCFNGNNGSATVTPAGGIEPYTYLWSNGQTAPTATGLTAGLHTCTITGTGTIPGTILATATVSITQPATAVTTTVTAQTNVSCFNGNNGAVTLAASGGTGALAYSWLPSGGTNASATALAANTYTCVVKDANNCITNKVVAVTQPAAVTASVTAQANVLCNNGNDGAVTVTSGGGTGSLTYSWLPSGGSNASASGLTANTYTCSVADANGCSAAAIVSVTQPAAIASSQTLTLCLGQFVSVGSSTYSSAGTYSDILAAANTCDSTVSTTVIVNTVDTSVTANVSVFTANAASATYQWLDCSASYSVMVGETSQTFTATVSGTYAVIVTENGCPDTSSCYSVLLTGVGGHSNSGIFVFPNPAHDLIQIVTGNGPLTATVQILSLEGKLMMKRSFAGEKDSRIDISELPEGFYFIEVNKEGIISRMKVVKN